MYLSSLKRPELKRPPCGSLLSLLIRLNLTARKPPRGGFNNRNNAQLPTHEKDATTGMIAVKNHLSLVAAIKLVKLNLRSWMDSSSTSSLYTDAAARAAITAVEAGSFPFAKSAAAFAVSSESRTFTLGQRRLRYMRHCLMAWSCEVMVFTLSEVTPRRTSRQWCTSISKIFLM